MAEVKKLRAVLTMRIEEDDSEEYGKGKSVGGYMCVLNEVPTETQKELKEAIQPIVDKYIEEGKAERCTDKIKNKTREVKIMVDSLKHNVIMSWVNGWVINEVGNAECLYCRKIIEGYDYGKCNEVTKNFNIRTTPCTCRT